MMGNELRKIVEESFRMMGYEQVKPEQWTAIKVFVSGVDVFVALPTGFGESLIYATLPLKGANLPVSILLCFLFHCSCLLHNQDNDSSFIK